MFAAVQLLRIVLKPPFRRDMVALPALAVTGWVIALAGAALLAWMMIRWPLVLHSAAALSVLGLAAAWWRARPSYGRSRGWPPGSLALGASLDAIDDRTYYLDQSRVHGPVFKMSQFGRPVLCVVGLARGRKLLNENANAIVGASLPYNRLISKEGSLRYMTRQDHKQEGPLFRTAFSAMQLELAEPVVRAACRSMLLALSRDSRRTSDGVRPRDYLGQWVLVALAKIFFGLQPGDARTATLDRAQRDMTLDRMGGPRWRRQLDTALGTATGVLREIAGKDAASRALHGTALGALLAADPEAMDSDARARNLFFIFRLGLNDATALLDWVLTKLTDNPEWQEKVRGAPRTLGGPQGSQPPDCASRVVLETLRMEQSEFLYRRIVRPIVVEGFSIPAGWLMRICVQESHRDPAVYPDPDRFDPDRFAGHTFGRAEYSPFGADDHGCLGRPIVQFLGRIFVEEICHGYQWRVTRDGPLERGTRHRHHWRPSANRRVVMDSLGSERDLAMPVRTGGSPGSVA